MRIAIILGLFVSSAAFAIGPVWPLTDTPRFWLLGEGNAHFSVDASYFHTTENYGSLGDIYSPSTMDHLRFGSTRFHLGFGFGPQVSVFGQADLRAVFEKNTPGSNISDEDNYGFGDAFLALRWLLYRSRPSSRVYPSEWSPETWLTLVETSWVFPLYAKAKSGKPPLGDQSNDLTVLGRLVWYANDWLGLSGSVGYTHRTFGYADAVPWNLRADFAFKSEKDLRLWLNFESHENAKRKYSEVINPKAQDPLPGGSLLFKSESPTQRVGTLGLGYLLSKEWELAVGTFFTASGMESAKGFGGSLGLVWRPYQVPEIKYEEYREQQLKKAAMEPYSSHREVARYGLKATILRVSASGNFFQIGYGKKDGIKAGDMFQIFAPDDLSGAERTPAALAVVKVSRADDSFLRVEQKYSADLQLKPGLEAQRVIFAE